MIGGASDQLTSMRSAKRSLAVIWFVGSGIVFLIVLGQTVGRVYGDEVEKAWAWLLPSIMPTLSLIVGVLVSDAQQSDKTPPEIDSFLVKMAVVVSIIYLLTVLGTILLQPIVRGWSTPLGFLNISHLWLAPLQGLVSAFIGALFVKQNSPQHHEPVVPEKT
jgi:hypothetical protein